VCGICGVFEYRGARPVDRGQIERVLSVANYDGSYPLKDQQLREWAILDTFDWCALAYDQPQARAALRSWLIKAGLDDLQVSGLGLVVG
jgi:hypothetical protein